ncbi:MAG TPA: prepilin-type N-terminal cleavage/methylation domain-containing protein [Abditibacterium sp.]
MKNCLLAPRARRGFTLVEMLVVISVIALLAAIMFPVFGRVREGGRRTACNNNLRQLGLGFTQYRQDHNGRFPGAGQYQKWAAGGHWISGQPNTPVADINTKEPVADAASPTGFKTANVEKGAIYSYVKEPKTYSCPSNATAEKKLFSYSMNCAIAGMSDVRVKEPANIILLVDEEKANDGYLYTAGKLTGGGTSTDELTQRHNTSGNILFVDGHVKAYPFAVFPLTDTNSTIKVDVTRGKIRFQDSAFGPSGYFEGSTAFGNCFAP